MKFERLDNSETPVPNFQLWGSVGDKFQYVIGFNPECPELGYTVSVNSISEMNATGRTATKYLAWGLNTKSEAKLVCEHHAKTATN